MKLKQLHLGMLAVLTAMMMTGCHWNEDPVRQSLDIEATDLMLTVGQSASRQASTQSKVSNFVYSSSKPSVAIVDQNGTVTAMSDGEAVITVHMDETREGWYAATDRTYRVVVKNPSSEQLRKVDRTTPLTLVAQEDGKITVNFKGGITLSSDIHYTVNGGGEQTISKSTSGSFDITVKKYDVVQLYSNNSALSSGIASARGMTRAVADGAKYINITPSVKTEIYGNIMSLLEGKKFNNDYEIETNYAFYGLFAGAEKLENNLFRHLELPAYELTDGCYQAMFYGCKGLQRAPDLPAGAMSGNCYKEMFAGCSKLSYVKCLADDISAEGCTKDWLADAGTEASSEKKVATTFEFPTNSNDGVPAGWTNEVLYPVKSVTLDKTSLEMIAGSAETGTVTLTATVGPEYASDKTVFWLTSNEKVATVDDDGKVTAVGSGEAKITATAGGKHASCTVKVTVLVNSITLDKTELDMKVGDGPVTLTATVIPDGATDKTVTWSSSNEKAATVDSNGKVTAIGNGETTITATAGGKSATCKVKVAMIINLATLTGNRTANNGDVLTGTLGNNYKISIADGAIVTLDGVTINGENSGMYAWAGITCEGNATIILKDGTTNTVKGFKAEYPGIYVPKDKTLTIKGETAGTGSLTANSNGLGPGIGGIDNVACGNIEIQGGKITATGGYKSAGIGSGSNESCGSISIKGGEVTANGGEFGPGIGCSFKGTCGAISISGGTVTANGGNYGAGIGSGSFAPTCGAITISGGTVTATGGESSAGIGGSSYGSCTTITITTGVTKVTAKKGNNAPNSIGAGRSGEYGTSNCSTVTIGGTVYWDGSAYQNGGDDYLKKSSIVYPSAP